MKSKIQNLKNEKFIKKADIFIIIAVVLAIAISSFAFQSNSLENPQYKIYVANQLYKTGDLSENATIEIKTQNGNASLVVENGKIHMLEADCPDGLCKSQGEISSTASKIICLPLKIVCEITNGEKSEIDAVS